MPGIAVCPDVWSPGRLYLVQGARNQGNTWGNELQDTYQGFTGATALLRGVLLLGCSLSVQASPREWSIAALFHPLGKQTLTVRKQIKKEYGLRYATCPLCRWRPTVPHHKTRLFWELFTLHSFPWKTCHANPEDAGSCGCLQIACAEGKKPNINPKRTKKIKTIPDVSL